MNVDGSTVVRLTTKTKDDLRPAWSRSGARCSVGRGQIQWQLELIGPTGDRPPPHKTKPKMDATPGW